VRYVDDLALFHDDPRVLEEWRGAIACFLFGRRLLLHPDKTFIAPACEAATFLGFVTMPECRRLPEENVRRFRNRLRGLRDRWRAGTIDAAGVTARIGAWIAHAEHANTWRLRHSIFRGGIFDPAREPGWSPDRSRCPRWLLEQSTRESPVGQSQQERARQSEQQCWISGLQHASMPEFRGLRTAGACG
jgi:hypothetical protein